MKAIVYTQYGSPEVLKLTEIDKPSPKDHEVLIKVYATTAAAGDWRLRKADPIAARLFNGLLRPRKVTVLGFELSGTVEAIGTAVERFRPGDEVFAFAGFGFGAYAEYICLPAVAGAPDKGVVAKKPANISFAEAAAVPCGGLTALAFLRQAELRSGQTALIYGASGSVGTYAVQLARHFGAAVTGVCSGANAALVQSLGAERVVDYTQKDPLASGDRTYDVIFDAVGKCPAAKAKRCLNRNGRYISVRGSARLLPDDLDVLRELVEAGTLRAVIDRRYPLEEIVEAHRYIETGRKKGNVVITMNALGAAPA